MQSMIAEQGQEIQKLNAHIARLAESDLVFVENKKLIEKPEVTDRKREGSEPLQRSRSKDRGR